MKLGNKGILVLILIAGIILASSYLLLKEVTLTEEETTMSNTLHGKTGSITTHGIGLKESWVWNSTSEIIHWSISSDRIAVLGRDSITLLGPDGSILWRYDSPGIGHGGRVTVEKDLVVVCNASGIFVYNTSSREAIYTDLGSISVCRYIVLHDKLVLAARMSSLVIFDTSTGSTTQVNLDSSLVVTGLVYDARDNKVFLAASGLDRGYLYSIGMDGVVLDKQVYMYPITSLDYCSGLLAIGFSKSVLVVDSSDLAPVSNASLPIEGLNRVELSPGSRYVISTIVYRGTFVYPISVMPAGYLYVSRQEDIRSFWLNSSILVVFRRSLGLGYEALFYDVAYNKTITSMNLDIEELVVDAGHIDSKLLVLTPKRILAYDIVETR